MSIENPTLVHFRHFSSLLTNEYQESSYLRAYKALHLSRTLYKSALFMQNEANFRKSQMNVNIYYTKVYENISDWTLGENEPKTNPIKPNLLDAQMNVSSILTKDYENVPLRRRGENKPNQTQPVVSLSNLFQTGPFFC